MNMKKMTLASLIVIVALSVSSLACADVKVDNIKANTTVNGAVTAVTVGNDNKLVTNVGSVSGNVEGKSIELQTTVNGAVTNVAIGNRIESIVGVGSVTSH